MWCGPGAVFKGSSCSVFTSVTETTSAGPSTTFILKSDATPDCTNGYPPFPLSQPASTSGMNGSVRVTISHFFHSPLLPDASIMNHDCLSIAISPFYSIQQRTEQKINNWKQSQSSFLDLTFIFLTLMAIFRVMPFFSWPFQNLLFFVFSFLAFSPESSAFFADPGS